MSWNMSTITSKLINFRNKFMQYVGFDKEDVDDTFCQYLFIIYILLVISATCLFAFFCYVIIMSYPFIVFGVIFSLIGLKYLLFNVVNKLRMK